MVLFPGEKQWREKGGDKKVKKSSAPAPTFAAASEPESPGIPDDLESLTLAELQEIGRQVGLGRVTGLSKSDLIERIRGA